MPVLTGSWVYDTIAFLVTILTMIPLYYKWAFGYFKRHGIPEQQTPPSFPFGHMKGLSVPKNVSMCAADLYKESKEKVSGVYFLTKPVIFINDPDVAKEILVKEFTSFHGRWFHTSLKVDSFTSNLFLLNGQDWRSLRVKLSPAFTSGKIKTMFETLFAVGDGLIKVLDRYTSEPDVEVKEILARYTTDVISSVAFGIECKSLENPDCDFGRYARGMSEFSIWMYFIEVLMLATSSVQHYISLRLFPMEMTGFFRNTVKSVMEYRQKNNVKRNDFMQLLLQLKTQGYISDADHKQSKQDTKPFTLELAAAQAFVFFFAGFDTSSAIMQFALYELALNPDLQKQVQNELEEAVANHDGQMTYEGLNNCDLLGRVVSETLRKYPPVAALLRHCSRDYQVPDTDVTIKKGTDIMLPVYGYHHDPKYYPHPEKFDPDRFLPEEKAKRHNFTFLPFGEGPRYCIGSQFGLTQTKAGLSIILMRYNITPSKRTPLPLEFHARSNILSAKGGMYLKLTLRS